MNDTPETNLSVGRNIKIGFFHLGSGMADVLTTGVWNRIMISDLGYAATPIGLLVSLRYFLAPLGIWAGRMSDQHAVFGYRRLFWVWLGRMMMIASTFALGFQTADLARGSEATALTWIILAAALFLFSMGSAISGSTFLALVYDRSTPSQRGRVVGIVWTFLLIGFTIGGILFGVLLPEHDSTKLVAYGGDSLSSLVSHAELLSTEQLSFSPDTLQNLFLVAGVIMGGLWFFSLLGEEKRSRTALAAEANGANAEGSTSVWSDLKLVWKSRPMRFFCIYLALSMLFAFSQDLILEPFAAEVFEMPVRTTSRFSAYWGSMAILGTLLFLWLSRRVKWLTNTNMSYLGIVFLILTFGVFALSSFAEIRGLVTPGLILLGIGLGIWNVGTLGLMMDMSPLQRAGTFLGFWTLVVTFARGFGVSSGGIVRDLMLGLTGSDTVSYGLVFALGAVGLTVSLWSLWQAKVRETRYLPAEAAAVFAGAME
ncbi:MAG: BCD family MFS transporter [Anaerolineae bacterium]|nr:BCD family MFS transporter [Anaerolineae bacterium]